MEFHESLSRPFTERDEARCHRSILDGDSVVEAAAAIEQHLGEPARPRVQRQGEMRVGREQSRGLRVTADEQDIPLVEVRPRQRLAVRGRIASSARAIVLALCRRIPRYGALKDAAVLAVEPGDLRLAREAAAAILRSSC